MCAKLERSEEVDARSFTSFVVVRQEADPPIFADTTDPLVLAEGFHTKQPTKQPSKERSLLSVSVVDVTMAPTKQSEVRACCCVLCMS